MDSINRKKILICCSKFYINVSKPLNDFLLTVIDFPVFAVRMKLCVCNCIICERMIFLETSYEIVCMFYDYFQNIINLELKLCFVITQQCYIMSNVTSFLVLLKIGDVQRDFYILQYKNRYCMLLYFFFRYDSYSPFVGGSIYWYVRKNRGTYPS